MPATIDPDQAPVPLWRRLAWFFGLALVSAAATAAAAYGLRAVLRI